MNRSIGQKLLPARASKNAKTPLRVSSSSYTDATAHPAGCRNHRRISAGWSLARPEGTTSRKCVPMISGPLGARGSTDQRPD